MTRSAAPRPLTFELAPVAVADPDLAAELRGFLLAAGASRVEPIRVGKPPSDRRTAGPLEIVAFAVTLTGTVAQIVELCRGWLSSRRRPGATSIKVTVNGDQIEVTCPSTRTEDALVDAFVQRHGSP